MIRLLLVAAEAERSHKLLCTHTRQRAPFNHLSVIVTTDAEDTLHERQRALSHLLLAL